MEEGREERRRDSAAETVGRAARRETAMRRAQRAAARRMKGTRWPMPALGMRRMCGRMPAEEDG